MGGLTPELEKKLLVMTPRFVEIAKSVELGKKLSKAEVEAIRKMYPDVFEFAKNATFEEVMEFNHKYQDHKTYGEYLRFFQKPEGKELIEYLLNLAKEYPDVD